MTDEWEAMVVVGRVARPHGNRGEVIVNPETDFPEERFRPGETYFIRRGDSIESVAVIRVRFHRGRPIIGIEAVESIDAAETLAGLELRIPAAALCGLPADTFYRHDLIGCRVRTASGEQIGIVRDVEGAVSGSRLVIEGRAGEILVPLVHEICLRVDLSAREVVIAPPEGLLELNTTSQRKDAT